ncbi:hypothetical protein MRX96_043174 [Rhipicephalus microplus]
MSIIIRLQNLPWAANSLDIRRYFQGLSIPEGGVHIVGGEKGGRLYRLRQRRRCAPGHGTRALSTLHPRPSRKKSAAAPVLMTALEGHHGTVHRGAGRRGGTAVTAARHRTVAGTRTDRDRRVPMSAAEVLMTLAERLNPQKFLMARRRNARVVGMKSHLTQIQAKRHLLSSLSVT